nr:gustatory receptor 2 [Tropidothorax elegans]QQP19797.1 gustatory receptor 7 [Tropidothorax elegans]
MLGIEEFSFCSFPTTYSVLFYVGSCAMNLWTSLTSLREKIVSAETFGELDFWIIVLVFGWQVYLLPLSYWWDAPSTRAYFKKWRSFEEFVKVDRRELQGVRTIRIATYSALPISVIFLIVNKFIFVDISVFVFIQFVPVIAASFITIILWAGTLYELKNFSRYLADRIIKARCEKELEYRRQTSLKLIELTLGLGKALGSSLISISIIFFTCFVLCVYTLMVGRQDNSGPFIFGLFSGTLLFGSPIFLLAETGHRAIETIRNDFFSKIIKIDMTKLSPSCKSEIKLILDGTMRLSAGIEYNGFVASNRQTLTSIAGSAVTYLIVLVQFNGKPPTIRDITFSPTSFSP